MLYTAYERNKKIPHNAWMMRYALNIHKCGDNIATLSVIVYAGERKMNLRFPVSSPTERCLPRWCVRARSQTREHDGSTGVAPKTKQCGLEHAEPQENISGRQR